MKHEDGIAPAMTVMVITAVVCLIVLEWHPLAVIALALAFGGIAVNEFDLWRRKRGETGEDCNQLHPYASRSRRERHAPRRTLQRRERAARMQ